MHTDFSLRWEKFLNGFDSLEELGYWDKEANGEMDAYCENLLVSILMHFMAVDGTVKKEEVEKMNAIFGFDYGFLFVEQICKTMDDKLAEFVDNPQTVFALVTQAQSKIAEALKELLVEACRVVIESDGVVAESEKTSLDAFIDKLSKC